MMVSVLHKELEWQVEKAQEQKVGGHAAEDKNKSQLSIQFNSILYSHYTRYLHKCT